MSTRFCILIALLAAAFMTPANARAQNTSVPAWLEPSVMPDSRAIRRDIPFTNVYQRALEAGTRDFTGMPGENYWQLETDFDIEATIVPSTQILHGSETITIHNNSPDELDRIVLRLDHNIFRGLVPRGGSVPAENTEGMEVTRIVVNGDEVDLAAQGPPRRRGGPAPEARLYATGLDQTRATVFLARPIAAGSTATLEIDWNTKLPGGPNGRGHRMTQRWENRLFQPTQWFPRLAKYDDLRGWDSQVYLGPAEFFNNFGRFDVKITMPGGWIVSGTGVLQNPGEVMTHEAQERMLTVLESDDVITIVGEDEVKTPEAESLTWHFVADKVNDFAWATSNDFIWQTTRAIIPENGPVPIHMVYLPERANLFEFAAERSRHALEFYSDLWAPYPFPQLTLQDGPSAGMEYPMVINSNQGAADHEVAHQWWPMMVGTNETWYGWMDEGFNTYMNILSRADVQGEPADLTGLGQSYGAISGNEEEAPSMYVTNYGGSMYGFQTYRKAPLMLAMLGGMVGDEAVQEAMSAYTHAWAFKHPSPWDFMFFISNALEMDLGWFWYYWLFTTESVDGSIEDVSSSRGRATVTVRQDGQMPSPVVLEAEFSDGSTERFSWPVDVWFSGDKTFVAELTFDRGLELSRITFDPDGRFPDGNPSDNIWEK